MSSHFLHRLLCKDDRFSWSQHLSSIRAFRNREREIMQWPVLPETSGAVTAYVANFKRPQNIVPIVHALLASPSIDRVIVSNNNPACNLRRWFHPPSDRVTIIEHSAQQSCAMRYQHLRQFPSPFYFVIDDDLLLLPSQIEQLLAELQKSPSTPHGLYGQQWEHNHFHGGMQNQERSIDIMSRVYAFTAAHLREFFLLAAAIGMPEGHSDWNLSYFDDMLLSFCGDAKARIHDCGLLVDCPTQGAKEIATWRRGGFHAVREDVYRKLCLAKTLP